MAFQLTRGGSNVPAEVQRWQYFLRQQGIPQVGPIDADFGLNTETATRFFQVSHGLSATGKVNASTLGAAAELGYTLVPDDYYAERAGPDFPGKPAGLRTPTNALRNSNFRCFNFLQRPRDRRPDAEAIVQKGSCDGAEADWVSAHIVDVDIPQLRHARGSNGRMRCHVLAAPIFRALFEQWEKDDLLHLVTSYEGCHVPRYIRRKAPAGNGGHGLKRSSDVQELSNHSFGSAFDIDFVDNQLGAVPAFCGRRGSVRELVASANAMGVFWGGHFGTRDGMHFEISRLG